MHRRTLLQAAGASGLGVVHPVSDAFLPALIRIILGIGVRGTASAAARGFASRAVTRQFVRGGVTRTVQTVTTAEIGLNITGVVALSVTAAELISNYDCKALCVQGVSDTANVISEALKRPTHVSINIIDSFNNTVEDTFREYVNSGNFKYSFTLPRSLGLGVKRLDGKADDDQSIPQFSTGNILLAGIDDVFSS